MQQGYWVSVHQAQKEVRSKVVPDSPFTWIYKLPLRDGPIEGRGTSKPEARKAFIEKFIRIKEDHPELLPRPSAYDPVRDQLDALEFFDRDELQKSSG